MVHFLRQYGYTLVFLAVLAENLGLPVPSFPLILVGAALAAELRFRVGGLVVIGITASLIGDGVWYLLGRIRGRGILRKLCSISLSPDSCVNRTENLFSRHGLKSLLVAKFLPGLNTVAPPLAGMLRISPWRFLLFDLGGIGIWLASALLLGLAFRSRVTRLIDGLAAFGNVSLVILAVLLAVWLGAKWIERRQFYRLLERSRISAPELKQRLDGGENIVIVDLRSDLGYRVDGLKVHGAMRIPPHEFELRYKEIPSGRPVVMYCT